jgi:2-iminoacetate synthase ThiH
MDKDLYVTVARSVKAALPNIHLHAFSPEEVIYGAKRNKISILEMMTRLKDAGVNSFPGEKREVRKNFLHDQRKKHLSRHFNLHNE